MNFQDLEKIIAKPRFFRQSSMGESIPEIRGKMAFFKTVSVQTNNNKVKDFLKTFRKNNQNVLFF
ncbi:MAG: hypothetical protein WC942_01525 [Clostridia bacterium]|jgi:hypothetical protein